MRRVGEEAEEVDDDEDDQVSFASRTVTVYLENFLKFAKKLEDVEEKHIHQGIQDCKSLTGRY